GVSDSELSFITALSYTDHHGDTDLQNIIGFLTDLQANSEDDVSGVKLPELPESVAADMDQGELDSLPRSTQEQMMQQGSRFIAFMRKHTTKEVQSMTNEKLGEYLRFYYFGLKKSDGSLYSPATLTDIMNGPEFEAANRMLRVKVRHFSVEGAGVVQQFQPIEDGDLRKIRQHFDRSTAEELQDEVVFVIFYTLGERPGAFGVDSKTWGTDGHSYLKLPPLPTKNQSSDPTKCKGNVAKQSRIYGAERDLILHYQLLLPEGDNFFPRPLANASNGVLRFSSRQVRGVNWLCSFMGHLSEVCSLSQRYTNHCIRVTRISDLFVSGHSMDEIMAVTGQRSEATDVKSLSAASDSTLDSSLTTPFNNLAGTSFITSPAGSTVAVSVAQQQLDAAPERVDVAVEGAGKLAESKKLASGQAEGIREFLELTKVGSRTAVKGEETLEGGVLLLLRVGVVGLEDTAGLSVVVRLVAVESTELLESGAGEQTAECLVFVDVVKAGAVDAVYESVPEAQNCSRVGQCVLENGGADEPGRITSSRKSAAARTILGDQTLAMHLVTQGAAAFDWYHSRDGCGIRSKYVGCFYGHGKFLREGQKSKDMTVEHCAYLCTAYLPGIAGREL
uniref:PIPK domain-containing protein n=1 Tax=Macrostomum lignano TaxID=282301 RepID=A0A1I8H8Y0_9PLAT